MTATVIIPTYQGVNKILSIITALENQTNKDFEVIVLVDGSTDKTIELLEKKQFNFKRFQVIVQQNKGRSGARNAGVQNANGNLFIFYDDDMVPPVDSVENHIRFHSTHKGILGGNPIEEESIYNADILNYKAWLSKKWTSRYADGINILGEEELFLTGANMSITRDLFLRLNGFDERLRDAEDYDLGMRALKMGIPVFFDKSNAAEHKDPITCRSYIKRIREYSLAREKLRQMRPEWGLSVQIKSRQRRTMYRFLTFDFLINWIDKNYFVILPRKLRYKFYDVLIHAFGEEHLDVKI